MDVNKFTEAARYMSIIKKYEWEYGDYVCECCGDTVDEATLIL